MSVADLIAKTVNSIDDRLSQAGRRVKLLWRDDGFFVESAHSAALVSMARRYRIRPLVAAVPGKMSDDLVLSSEFLESVDLAQHGYLHANHAAGPDSKSEYPSTRVVEEVMRELRDGLAKLERVAGAAVLPIFVPPWSAMDVKFLPCLKGAGFRGFSSDGAHGGEAADATFSLTNGVLDITNDDPNHPASIKSVPWLLSTAEDVMVKRDRRTNQPDTFVILTHHQSLKEDGWEFLDAFFRFTSGRETMRWITFRELLAPATTPPQVFLEGGSQAETRASRDHPPVDIDRWNRVKSEQPSWDGRNMLIADHVAPNSSVLDVGAGAMTLKSYLPAGCTYQPVDVVLGCTDTLLANFNTRSIPVIPARYDYVVCSGVLEYIVDVDYFLNIVKQWGERIILSYAILDLSPDIGSRKSNGWFNHFTKDQLEKTFVLCGLRHDVLAKWKSQMIYELTIVADNA